MRDIEADGAQLDAAPEVMCDAVNLTHLLTSVRAAGSAILKVKEQGVSARYKADASPVTLADEQANAISAQRQCRGLDCEYWPDKRQVRDRRYCLCTLS